MKGLVKQVGVGLVLSLGVGAIVSCQNTAEAPPQVTPSQPPTTEQPATSQPNAAEPAPPVEPGATAPDEAPAESTASQPEPRPVPPLPAECSNAATQTAMNRCAQAEYEQADVKLNNAYQAVKASLGAEKNDQLVAAEQAWIDFRDSYCNFVQSQFAGGSIQPTVYAGCLTQLTADRTAELQGAKGATLSYNAADAELNQVYQDLQGYLSAAEKDLLTNAQLAWIDYRDLHCAFAGGDTNACLAQVTETRVNQLREQLDTRSM